LCRFIQLGENNSIRKLFFTEISGTVVKKYANYMGGIMVECRIINTPGINYIL